MRRQKRTLLAIALCCGLALSLSCSSSSAKRLIDSGKAKSSLIQPGDPDDLQAAMDKLQASLEKPAAPFHASFKKSGVNGFSAQCEADVSADGISGQQTDFSPATEVGSA